jgi:serine/threonine-protein kinase
LHRDLKPANILVTRQGDVKILDFGAAKLLDGDHRGAASEFTERNGALFTREFAAPEQLTGSGVSTATDVYSLGVILFELLAGTHPIPGETSDPAARMQLLVAKEPLRLSDAAHHMAADVARRRGAEPGQLRRSFRGDLDIILAKALKKDPDERY